MKRSERNQIERVRDENFASKLGKSNSQFLFVGKTNRANGGAEESTGRRQANGFDLSRFVAITFYGRRFAASDDVRI